MRTLLVEDNPVDADLLREALLEVAGDDALAVCDCVATALAWLAAGDGLPPLILTDHHLPDGTGLDLAAGVRGCPRLAGVPIVMLSGDVLRPPGLGTIPWYEKPDTWKGWLALARELHERYLRPR